jgi:hypothetical protein
VCVEFGFALEKFGSATAATKGSNAIFVEEFTGAGSLGSRFSEHVVLHRV